jgi:hypothetical protein
MTIGENKESLDPHAKPLPIFRERKATTVVSYFSLLFPVMRRLAPNQIKNCVGSKSDCYWFVETIKTRKNDWFLNSNLNFMDKTG